MIRGAAKHLLGFASILTIAAGCTKDAASPSDRPATHPALASQERLRTLDRPDLGVRLSWPAGWVAQPLETDLVLVLVPEQLSVGIDVPSVSLDVPKLPWHIPGMIPIGSVRNGYLDDLRKHVGPIETFDLTPPKIPDATTRLVSSMWTDKNGVRQHEKALLAVHADRVYIVRARGPLDDRSTGAAFDHVVRSLRWTDGRNPERTATAPAR